MQLMCWNVECGIEVGQRRGGLADWGILLRCACAVEQELGIQTGEEKTVMLKHETAANMHKMEHTHVHLNASSGCVRCVVLCMCAFDRKGCTCWISREEIRCHKI